MSLCFSLSLSLSCLFSFAIFFNQPTVIKIYSPTLRDCGREFQELARCFLQILLTIFFRNYYRKFCGILWNWRKSKYLRNYDYNVTEGEENRRTTLFSFAILVHSIDIVNIHFLTREMGHGREFRRKFRSVLSRHLLPPSFFNFTKLEIIEVFARL